MTACHPPAWHHDATVRALLADLSPVDLRLVVVRGLPAGDRLGWVPASARGMAILAELTRLHQAAIGPAFVQARDDLARLAALDAADRAFTVEAAIADRFGDPLRWQGLGPLDATRRFRANWRDGDGA